MQRGPWFVGSSDHWSGLDLRGNYEPGDSLVDLTVAACDSDRVACMPWDVVSRDHAMVTGTKKDATSALMFQARSS